MDPYVWWILALLLIVMGTIGTFVPGIPGPVLVFAGMLLAAWAEHFSRIGWVTLTILGLLMAIAVAIEIGASLIGARRVGASRLALIGAAVGAVVGLFFGLVGILIGPFLGAVIGELMSRRGLAPAVRVGVGTWVGTAVGIFAKMAIVFVMLAVFLVSYFI
jgi:hypothetical protein